MTKLYTDYFPNTPVMDAALMNNNQSLPPLPDNECSSHLLDTFHLNIPLRQ